MAFRAAKWLVVLALTLSLGAHWALLQSMAWVGMLVTYSQDATVGEALTKTFDGEHPCQLCHFVREGRKAESKHEQSLKLEAKKQFICESVLAILYPPAEFSLAPLPRFQAVPRADVPPLPPPRAPFA